MKHRSDTFREFDGQVHTNQAQHNHHPTPAPYVTRACPRCHPYAYASLAAQHRKDEA